MWPIVSEPFDIARRDPAKKPPFWHALDYTYRFDSEDRHNRRLKEIELGRLVLAEPLSAKESLRIRNRNYIRLGGRALLTLWQNRNEIPERLWERHEETLPHTGAKVSSFAVDGLRILNPHGAACTFYLVRFGGEVRWGITPVTYNRGPNFKALVYLC
ncbi:MAG: hypothetical protein AAB919_03970 [Patescibacteria group bacterium]